MADFAQKDKINVPISRKHAFAELTNSGRRTSNHEGAGYGCLPSALAH